MEVKSNESKVRITEDLPVPRSFNILATLANLKASAVKDLPGLPTREIGSIEATGFVIEQRGVQFNVWIDPVTNLPLEMENLTSDLRLRLNHHSDVTRFDRPCQA